MTNGSQPVLGESDSAPPERTDTPRSLYSRKSSQSTLKRDYEEDPNGIGQHDPGAKLDAGKEDTSLLLMFGRALLAVSAVGTFGARKYTRGGWQFVDEGQNRYTAALLRHVLKEQQEDYDVDSGFLHQAHAAWNALARLELTLREEEENDAQASFDF